jgi:hypothetical protein
MGASPMLSHNPHMGEAPMPQWGAMSHLQPLQYRASNSAVYYVPPRPFSAGRLLLATLGATATAIVLALLYVWSLDQTMNLYVRLGLCVGFGMALGLASHLSMKWGRVYNTAIATLVACGVGLIAMYIAWAFWLHRYLMVLYGHVSTQRLLTDPVAMFHLMRAINHDGTWAYHGDAIQGFGLLLVWIVEAVIIVLPGALFAANTVKSQSPLCDNCRVWCKRISGTPRIAADRSDEIAPLVESRDFDALLEHGPLRDEDDPQIDFHVYGCPRCKQTNVLTVKRTEWGRDKDGRIKVFSRVLVDRMLLTAEQVEQLKALRPKLQEMKQPPTDAEQPAAAPNEPAGPPAEPAAAEPSATESAQSRDVASEEVS